MLVMVEAKHNSAQYLSRNLMRNLYTRQSNCNFRLVCVVGEFKIVLWPYLKMPIYVSEKVNF